MHRSDGDAPGLHLTDSTLVRERTSAAGHRPGGSDALAEGRPASWRGFRTGLGRRALLDPETSLVSAGALAQRPEIPGRARRLRDTADELLPRLSRSHGSRRNYELLARSVQDGRVLVVGGRTPGAGMEPLLEAGAELLETDLVPRPRTMIACDAQQLPFAACTFDAVVVQGVLGYVPDGPGASPVVQLVRGGRQRHARRAGNRSRPGLAVLPAQLRAVEGAALRAAWGGKADHVLAVFFLGRKADRTVSDREIVSGYSGAVGV